MQATNKEVSIGTQVFYQILLLGTSLVVLYPILWVVKMALTPSQAFSMDPWPIPNVVSFDNFWDVIQTTDSKGNWLFGQQLFPYDGLIPAHIYCCY